MPMDARSGSPRTRRKPNQGSCQRHRPRKFEIRPLPHLPYVTRYDEEMLILEGYREKLREISSGRCAAISYLNQDKRDAVADIARAEKMLKSGHMSPFEHVAQAMSSEQWHDYGFDQAERWVKERIPMGNLYGWKQFRKELADEHDFSKRSDA